MSSNNNFYPAKNARQSLWLFVPAASIGVGMATYISPGLIGQTIFTLTKIWLIIFPIFWRLKIEKKFIQFPKISNKQFILGSVLGIIMSSIIVAIYWFVGKNFLNILEVRQLAIAIGIKNANLYLLGVLYWSFVNSWIEECVWRGFVYRQCLVLQPRWNAIIFSALFFTLHHIIALFFYLQNPIVAILGSFGVFLAGVIWSNCYQRVGLWSCYISHILADLAIGFVGWHLLFS